MTQFKPFLASLHSKTFFWLVDWGDFMVLLVVRKYNIDNRMIHEMKRIWRITGVAQLKDCRDWGKP
jgi:hypothetical protein